MDDKSAKLHDIIIVVTYKNFVINARHYDDIESDGDVWRLAECLSLEATGKELSNGSRIWVIDHNNKRIALKTKEQQ